MKLVKVLFVAAALLSIFAVSAEEIRLGGKDSNERSWGMGWDQAKAKTICLDGFLFATLITRTGGAGLVQVVDRGRGVRCKSTDNAGDSYTTDYSG